MDKAAYEAVLAAAPEGPADRAAGEAALAADPPTAEGRRRPWRTWSVGLLAGCLLAAAAALAVASRRHHGDGPARGAPRGGPPTRVRSPPRVLEDAPGAASGVAALTAGTRGGARASSGVDALTAGAEGASGGVWADSRVDALTAGAEGAGGGARAFSRVDALTAGAGGGARAFSGVDALTAGAEGAGGGTRAFSGMTGLSAGAEGTSGGAARAFSVVDALSAGAEGTGGGARASSGVAPLSAAGGGAPANTAARIAGTVGAAGVRVAARARAGGGGGGAPDQAPPSAAALGARRVFPTGSLFCFSLLRDPFGQEGRLLGLQRQRRAGPFGCDESAVWTLEELQPLAQLGQGRRLGGGPTPAELARLWGTVVADGRFRSHAWTVRVDPDCVFFPGRLRWVLSGRREEAEHGVYMTGCSKDDSPIQVLSRRAAEAFAEGSGLCGETPGRIHLQPSGGEDAPMNWCLSVVLGVQRVSDRRLLLDSRCGARDLESCAQGHVAFHPLETEDSFNRCVMGAHSATLARVAV